MSVQATDAPLPRPPHLNASYIQQPSARVCSNKSLDKCLFFSTRCCRLATWPAHLIPPDVDIDRPRLEASARRARGAVGEVRPRAQLCAAARTMGSMRGHVRLARPRLSMASDDNSPPLRRGPPRTRTGGRLLCRGIYSRNEGKCSILKYNYKQCAPPWPFQCFPRGLLAWRVKSYGPCQRSCVDSPCTERIKSQTNNKPTSLVFPMIKTRCHFIWCEIYIYMPLFFEF